MEYTNLLQAIAALIFVIALIGLSSVLYRRFVLDKNLLRGTTRRLKIEENLYLDSRRKLVLVKKDDEEILILIGHNSETVISTNPQGSLPSAPVAEAPKPHRRKPAKP